MIKENKDQPLLTKFRKRQLSSIQQNIFDGFTDPLQLQTQISIDSSYQSFLAPTLITTLSHNNSPFIDPLILELINHKQNQVYQTLTVSEQSLVENYFSFLQVHSLDSLTLELATSQRIGREERIVQEILVGETQVGGSEVKENVSHQYHSRVNNSGDYPNKYYSEASLNNQKQRKRFTSRELHQVFRSESLETQLVSKYIKEKAVERRLMADRMERAKTVKLRRVELEQREGEERRQREIQERSEALARQFEEKMMRRSQLREERIAREIQYKKLVRHQKPLFEILEKQDSQKRKEEEQELNRKLLAMKRGGKTLPQEISKFQEQYIALKQEKEKERQERLNLKLQECIGNKRYYRSKFHQFIEKSYVDHDESHTELEKLKQSRRIQYSKDVKDKIKVEVDERLRSELRNSMMRQQGSNKNRNHRFNQVIKSRYEGESSESNDLKTRTEGDEPSAKIDGLRFLKFAREKRNKTFSTKEPKQQEPKTDITMNHSQSRVSHLNDHQLLNKFISNIKQSKKANDTKKNLLKAKAFQLDEKAHRSQQLLRLHQHTYNKSYPDPQQYFIDAIRTKIQYLKL